MGSLYSHIKVVFRPRIFTSLVIINVFGFRSLLCLQIGVPLLTCVS